MALKGVLVVHDSATGAVAIAENLWLATDLVNPIETLAESYQVPDAERAQALLTSEGSY